MDPKILAVVNKLSDDELLERIKSLAEREREATASLIAHLAELDARRLYLAEGYSSLFSYCTQVLCLSESAAYRRIEAARIIRKFPVILDLLEEGLVNLTTAVLLAAHLTQENHREVLEAARLKSKRQVEELIARLHPQAIVPSTIRKLPNTSHLSGSPPAQQDVEPSLQPPEHDRDVENHGLPSLSLTSPRDRPATVAPLAPERYKVQFTASAEMYKKLRLAQDLLRHQIPNGDPAAIFDLALTALLETLTKKKLAITDHPRQVRDHVVSGSRNIPAEVRRAVWLRDGGRCAFVGRNGRRCTEQGFLEFHHVTPYAVGGQPTVDNIELRCRAHNGYEAELHFGSGRSWDVREPRVDYSSSDRVATGRLGPRIPVTTRSGTSKKSGAFQPFAFQSCGNEL
jgi:hypothetical protein